MSEIIQKVKSAIKTLETKTNKIYFFCMDSKGSAMAAVSTIYEHVKILRELGYNAIILTEKDDFVKPTWLGDGYEKIPHEAVSGESNQGALIGPQDFLILPEIYGGVLDQLKDANCEKIMFVQAYDYIFELMKPGITWGQFAVRRCLTTTKSQENYVNSLFPNIKTSIVSPTIPDYFVKSKEPKKPFIAIHCRESRETANFIKSFYIKHPFLKWITFRDMRGLTRPEFAEALRECALSVWIDPIAGFGTFPIESMKSGTPVIGLVPDLTPNWLTEKNGIWTNNKLTLVDTAASVMKNWLEDSVPQELYEEMEKTSSEFSEAKEAGEVASFYNELFEERIEELVIALNNQEQNEKVQALEASKQMN
jgi:hypothetical protein|tara:strand:- start:3431 stop:4525 length:1095 start_codon:yes stop_codon:yes gene_type:complete